MTRYVPADNPQPMGAKEGGASLACHESDYRAHGPPPPNYTVERAVTTRKGQKGVHNLLRYVDTSLAEPKRTFIHPCSPEAQSKSPAPTMADEPTLDRQAHPGIFEVPIVYKTDPAKMRWRAFDTWQGAIATALAARRVQNQHKRLIAEADVKGLTSKVVSIASAASDYNVLYHPADRQSMIFENEPTVSAMARHFGYSLIVICPFVQAGGVGYNRIWDTKDRPPMYARWSTGRQAALPPLVLGCLPKQTSTKNRKFECIWFLIEMNGSNRPDWATNMLIPNINVLAEGQKIGFPMNELKHSVFLWALVSLHRRMVLGYSIPDNHMACWLWQFGQHLVDNCKTWNNPHPVPFNYDSSKLSNYKQTHPSGSLTFARLTQWTLNAGMVADNIWIGSYARSWNHAIEAQIQYQLNKTEANFRQFRSKMELARRLPF